MAEYFREDPWTVRGTSAQRKAMDLSGIKEGTRFEETDTGASYVFAAGAWRAAGMNGVPGVRPLPGTGNTTKNRNLAGVTATHPGDDTTNTMTWTESENVRELVVYGGASGFLVVFDALDAADAQALLGETGGAGVDVQYALIPAGEVRRFIGTSYFTRADFVTLGAGPDRLIVEAQ